MPAVGGELQRRPSGVGQDVLGGSPVQPAGPGDVQAVDRQLERAGGHVGAQPGAAHQGADQRVLVDGHLRQGVPGPVQRGPDGGGRMPAELAAGGDAPGLDLSGVRGRGGERVVLGRAGAGLVVGGDREIGAERDERAVGVPHERPDVPGAQARPGPVVRADLPDEVGEPGPGVEEGGAGGGGITAHGLPWVLGAGAGPVGGIRPRRCPKPTARRRRKGRCCAWLRPLLRAPGAGGARDTGRAGAPGRGRDIVRSEDPARAGRVRRRRRADRAGRTGATSALDRPRPVLVPEGPACRPAPPHGPWPPPRSAP